MKIALERNKLVGESESCFTLSEQDFITALGEEVLDELVNFTNLDDTEGSGHLWRLEDLYVTYSDPDIEAAVVDELRQKILSLIGELRDRGFDLLYLS
ncbi:MAG: hypothetical protein EHM79_00270 [Geobacter sp.]|nr:MAG: hypothetical protein EHM79_00270 [Geobacter sp.]